MNYMGNKTKLLDFIDTTIQKYVVENTHDLVLCDLFAGTGSVGNYFRTKFKYIISNDIEFYAYLFNLFQLKQYRTHSELTVFIEEFMKNLPIIEDGFIYKNYCLGSGSKRYYFSDKNGKLIDSIIQKAKTLNDYDRHTVLAVLCMNISKVANTGANYSAFLKHDKHKSGKTLSMSVPPYDNLNSRDNLVFNQDAEALIPFIHSNCFDGVLYLDPPYNRRNYSTNYHLLNTIAKNETFTPNGITGLPPNIYVSPFCKKTEAKKSLEHIIKNANFKYIFLSYNNEGILSLKEIEKVMSKYGTYHLESKPYRRFKCSKIETAPTTVTEYIHVLIKEKS